MFRTLSRLTLAAAFCGVGMVALEAQTPTPDKQTKTVKTTDGQQVNQSTISTDEITLIRDMEKSPMEDRSPAATLKTRVESRQAGNNQAEQGRKSVDINKVRVIHPNNYNALSDKEKSKIDANPYYVVSDKSRREVMAEFINQQRSVTPEPAASEPAAPVDPKQ